MDRQSSLWETTRRFRPRWSDLQGRLRPRQGRYARVGFAIVVYFVYSQLLYAAKAWLEKGELTPIVGVWWVHLAALALGLYLVTREARAA